MSSYQPVKSLVHVFINVKVLLWWKKRNETEKEEKEG